AHSLNPKHTGANSVRWGRKNARSGHQCRIAALEDTMPLGIYEPISIGRFEGVFKLTKRTNVIVDRRPNPTTYKFKPVIPDGAYKGWPSKGALAQRSRRLRELSERLEEEREKTIHRSSQS